MKASRRRQVWLRPVVLVLAAVVVPMAALWLASEPDHVATPLERAASAADPRATRAGDLGLGSDSLATAEPLGSEREAAEAAEPVADTAERPETRVQGRVVDAEGNAVVRARVLLASADRGPSLPLDAEV